MRVIMNTSMGSMTIELDEQNAPISTENFLAYADAGEYDGTIFHRVIDGFMIQGGAFEPDMNQRQGSRGGIKNEWENGVSNTRGTLAMARLGNQPDSATNQFFINVSDNDFLDQPRDGAGYAVFGKVVEGLEIIDEIKGVDTTNKAGHGDVPVDTITIESVKRAD